MVSRTTTTLEEKKPRMDSMIPATNGHHHPQPTLFQHNNNNHHHHHLKRPRTDDTASCTTTTATAAAEAGADAARRPRGRPVGSKNKPKPPVIIQRDPSDTFRSHVLEAAPGTDVAAAIAAFARRRQRGVCVLYATGAVADVTLRQPGGAVLAVGGPLDIVSLCGSVLPPPAPPGASGITVYLAGGQGRVVGGSVVGSLVAAGTVVVMAASFDTAVYERLSADRDEEEGETGGGREESPEARGPVGEASPENGGGGLYQLPADGYGWSSP